MKKEYYIGTSGWNYPHWKEAFYPKNVKKKNWFDFYVENFNTVEVNYAFYRWPTKEQIDKWYNTSPSNFRMTLKAPRMITHMKKLKDVESLVKEFYELSSRLKEKMGCHLFQLPPNMKFNENNFEKLKRFVEVLDKRRDNAIEFRDKSWYKKEVFDLLEKHKVAFVTVDGLGMPSRFVKINSSQIMYMRFHGKHYSGDYDRAKLRRYAKKLKQIRNCKVYVYFNNDVQGYAPKNALEMKELLGLKK